MKRTCRECGTNFQGSGKAFFCKGTSCRRDWNNRRQQRGAELYDLFMTIRHERGLTAELKETKDINLWTVACQLASVWKHEDEHKRGSRRSWQFIPSIIEAGKYVYLKATYLGIDRTGHFSKPITTRRKAIS